MITIILTVIILMGIIFIFEKHRRFISMVLRIPSPATLPLIGDFAMLLSHKFHFVQALRLTEKPYGDCFRMVGRMVMVIVSQPEDMAKLLTNPSSQSRGPMFEGLGETMGFNSILTAHTLHDVKQHRKDFNKAFNGSSNKIIFEAFKRNNERLLSILENEEGKLIQMHTYLRNTVTGSFCESALDVSIDEYPQFPKLLEEIDSFGFMVICRAISPLHRNDFIYRYLFGARALHQLRREFNGIILSRLTEHQRTVDNLLLKGTEVPNQYIFNMIQEKPEATDEEAVTYVKTTAIAALETSAGTAGFTLLMLAMHPESQQLVYEETVRVQKELDGADLDEKNISKFEYLHRVIKETLRLYPAVPILPRLLNEDTKFCKYMVPKGVSVLGSVLTLHRDPNFYEKPTIFDPERFTPENFAKIPKNAYIPFAAGPRSCPGYRYGIHNVIYLVSSIINKYKVSTSYKTIKEIDQNLDVIVALTDRSGLPMSFERR